jgi:hypothetical protein
MARKCLYNKGFENLQDEIVASQIPCHMAACLPATMRVVSCDVIEHSSQTPVTLPGAVTRPSEIQLIAAGSNNRAQDVLVTPQC